MQVSVIGLGRAGLPLAAVIANSGIKVVGIDLSEERVKDINNKKNPIPEEKEIQPILDKRVPKFLSATTSFEEANESSAFIIVVPVVIDNKNKPDFQHLVAALKSLCSVLKKNDLVVVETTLPPGTTEALVKDTLESNSKLSAGKDFFLAYSPERIMTGYSISRYKEFPKIVGGIDEKSGAEVENLYSKFCPKVLKVKNTSTAELIKVCEGIYRDVNIGLANELYKLCDDLNVDFNELRENAKHTYCNILEAGIGAGGHCIPVYPWFIINNFNVPLIQQARKTNDSMVKYFAELVNKKNAQKVLIIGLSYREGVKEDTFARSHALIQELKNQKVEVFGLDPSYTDVETKNIYGIPKSEDFENMDLIIVANKNTEYKERLIMHKAKIVDIKGILR